MATWMCSCLTLPTGAQFCAISTSPPGLTFSRFHLLLSCRQLTLLTQLRTGTCNLGAYKAHFKPEQLVYACGAKPETARSTPSNVPASIGPSVSKNRPPMLIYSAAHVQQRHESGFLLTLMALTSSTACHWRPLPPECSRLLSRQ